MTSIATPSIKRAAFPLLLLLIGLALFGCRSSESEETATALSAAVRVELESLRATATVARARMQTTLDYVGTRIVQVEESGEFLSHSLNNLGTDSAFIEESLRQIADFATEAAPTEAPRAESRSSATAAPTARPAPVIVTPPDASPPPTRNANRTAL